MCVVSFLYAERERERYDCLFADAQISRFFFSSFALLGKEDLRRSLLSIFLQKKQLAVAKKKKKQEARSKKKQEEERETRERERKDDGVFWFFVIFRGGGGIASAKNRPRARLKTRLLGGLDAFRGRV